MAAAKHTATQASGARAASRFSPGTVVVVSLANPREKFWGTILELSGAGLAIRGIDLNSFDDYVSLLRAGEAYGSGEVFFPMHRVERIEADLSNGGIPSIAERFSAATGKPAAALLGTYPSRSVHRQ
jgi:hypothetical protein